MALKVCKYCNTATVVPGPRSFKFVGLCKFGGVCWVKAALALAEADMLSKEEADLLNVALGGSDGSKVL